MQKNQNSVMKVWMVLQSCNLIQEPSGDPSFKNIDIKLKLFSPDNHVKAKRLFNKVESQSMIVNSVTTKVDINWIIKQ